MAGSLNKVTLIGRLGNDPETRSFSNGGGVTTFSLATSETWKDRDSSERRERTEWHRISIFTDGLGAIASQYLRKGSLVYVEGKLETRKWERDGQDHYSTEVALRPFHGTLTMLGEPVGSGERAEGGERRSPARGPSERAKAGATAGADGWSAPKGDLDDDIPF